VITEDGYRFFETDIVFREIRDGLLRVPQHIIVYTLIEPRNQRQIKTGRSKQQPYESLIGG